MKKMVFLLLTSCTFEEIDYDLPPLEYHDNLEKVYHPNQVVLGNYNMNESSLPSHNYNRHYQVPFNYEKKVPPEDVVELEIGIFYKALNYLGNHTSNSNKVIP